MRLHMPLPFVDPLMWLNFVRLENNAQVSYCMHLSTPHDDIASLKLLRSLDHVNARPGWNNRKHAPPRYPGEEIEGLVQHTASMSILGNARHGPKLALTAKPRRTLRRAGRIYLSRA